MINGVSGPRVIVQASSRSWSGGRDLSMANVDGYPVIYWTIKRVFDAIPDAEVVVAAPAFDRGGELDFLVSAFPTHHVTIYYGHDASPLNRMVDVCQDLKDGDHIIRVDGLHFCFDTNSSLKMIEKARDKCLDCMKLPDDFPVQFASDIYRVGALRKLDRLLTEDTLAFRVHPKFYMLRHEDMFHCAYLQELPCYSDDYLLQCRKSTKAIYSAPRLEVNEHKTYWQGNQLGYHYELGLEHLQPWMKVLDIACGTGWGTRMLAHKVAEVYGADLDAEVIEQAKQMTDAKNIHFSIEDITQMQFPDSHFDGVTCMETIEHIDARSCLAELSRVLKPKGILVMSTPQNRMGHIPLVAAHQHEYSLKEIVELCGRYFSVKRVIGIKAGRIFFEDDQFGSATVLVLEGMKT